MKNMDKIINEFVKDRLLVYLQKDKDYGNSFLQGLEAFGEVSALVRIADKVNRFNTLINNAEFGLVEDESIDDTVLDLFNYVVMNVCANINEYGIDIGQLVVYMKLEAKCILRGDTETGLILDVLKRLDKEYNIRLVEIQSINNVIKEYILRNY